MEDILMNTNNFLLVQFFIFGICLWAIFKVLIEIEKKLDRIIRIKNDKKSAPKKTSSNSKAYDEAKEAIKRLRSRF